MIATLTFHNAYNYGALFQAVALQKAFDKLQISSEVLNYCCEAVVASYAPPKSLKGRIGWILRARDVSRRYEKFDAFRIENLRMSGPVEKRDLSDFSKVYRGLVVGSDQVWNPEITGEDRSYFLDFVADNSKKYSYAASVGVDGWPTEIASKLASLVDEFQVVCVREKTAAEYLTPLLGKTPEVSCDPVFLLSAEHWGQMAEASSRRKSRYALVVALGRPEKDCIEWARGYAQSNALDLVVLHASAFMVPGALNVRDAGPAEYLDFIRNAECVITNSFHACCFSVLFHRQLAWFRSKEVAAELAGREGRIRDLLSNFGIDDCCVTSSTAAFPCIDFGKVDAEVAEVRAIGYGVLARIASEVYGTPLGSMDTSL